MSSWPGNARREKTTFGGLRRGQLMARIRSQGNKTTELRLISLLRKAGVAGWRRHQRLLGRPDFIWKNAKVAVFVDGCFWHGHQCGRNVTPKTNALEWGEKIRRNRSRDKSVNATLRKAGWTVVRLWECHLRNHPLSCISKVKTAVRG
jgi:DNA mismatch endonuclease, patch repair protein